MRHLPWLRFAGLTMFAVSAVVSTACATKSINSVLADPARYRDREVTVEGTVIESFGVVDRGAYLLDDRTGQLWVVAERGTPRKGARVKAKGRIREGFNLGSLGDLIKVPGAASGLVLIESSRNASD
jgi:hypothetical protein